MRSDARRNEASALGNARREGIALGAEQERSKWENVVTDKDARIAELEALLKKNGESR